MRVAITGTSGFIGRKLATRLFQESDFDILTLSRYSEEPNESGDISTIVTDYSKDDLINILQGVDVIIHLAGQRMPRSKEYVPLEYFYDSNVKLTENILLACMTNRIKRVILTSSISVYGLPNGRIFTEEQIVEPTNNYALSKLICEKLLEQFSLMIDIETVSLRLGQVIGPGERQDLIIGNFFRKCKSGELINIKSSGLQKREYVYVDDVTEAILKVVKAKTISGVYNLGSKQTMNALEIATLIKTITNSNSKIISYKENDYPDNLIMSSEKLMKKIGWSSRWSIYDAIKETIVAMEDSVDDEER